MDLEKRRKAGKALWKRIQEAMDVAGIKNHAELARRLKVASPTISGWKRGDWAPKRENLIAISLFSGMSIEYLETGRGSKFVADKNEIEDRIISILRELPEEKQRLVLEMAEFERSRSAS